MANEQHIQLLKQGQEVWNDWRQEHRQLQPDLEDADLAGMNLDHFLLWKTRLKGANLANASLRHTSLFDSEPAPFS